MVIVCVVVAINGVASLTSTYVELEASATLERRMMAIDPVITETDRKGLIGQWALVNSRSDYEAVITKIDEIAKNHGIRLPKPVTAQVGHPRPPFPPAETGGLSATDLVARQRVRPRFCLTMGGGVDSRIRWILQPSTNSRRTRLLRFCWRKRLVIRLR